MGDWVPVGLVIVSVYPPLTLVTVHPQLAYPPVTQKMLNAAGGSKSKSVVAGATVVVGAMVAGSVVGAVTVTGTVTMTVTTVVDAVPDEQPNPKMAAPTARPPTLQNRFHISRPPATS